MSALRCYLLKQQFNPGLTGAFLNPFFLARRQLWREISIAGALLSGPLLDVGCGTKPYRSLFSVSNYIGLDIDNKSTRERGIADVFYDGTRFPFEDSQFNAVLCNQVLEHVFNPDEFIEEISRVLASGGKLLLTVPFVWDEHEQPYDYSRYSSFGLRFLLEQHAFRIVRQKKLLSDFSIIFQLINAYLFKVTRRKSKYLNLLITVVLLGPISLLGLVLGRCLPRNDDLFLDQLIVAESTK